MFRINEKKIIVEKWIFPIAFSGIIFFVCALGYDKLHFPSVMNDEFGYLGNAAYLAGYNWSEILTDIPYYSYGYSSILTPLFLIMENGADIYMAASIVNTFALIGSFFLLNYICKKLFDNISCLFRNAICLIATLNAYTLIMSGYALAECMLFFSICVWCAWLIHFLDKPSVLRGGILAILVAYIHLLHQRALAILVATTLMITCLTIIKKIDKRIVIVYFIVLIMGIVLQTEGKQIIKSAIWNTTVGTLENDYGGLYSVVFSLLSVDGLLNFIFSFVSKLYAIFTSYFYIPLFFMEYTLKKCWKCFEKKNIDKKTILMITLVLALICAFGITALFVMYPTRKDAIIYSRYVEYLLGPIIALGLCALKETEYKWSRIIVYIAIGILSGGVVLKAWSWVDNDNFIAISSPVLSIFFKDNSFHVFWPVLLIGAIFWILSISFSLKKKIIKYIIIVGIICMSVSIGYKVKADWDQFELIKKSTLEIGEQIEARTLEIDKIVEVFIIREPIEYYTMHYYGGFIQQYLPHVAMHYITLDKIDEIYDSNAELIMIVGENRDDLIKQFDEVVYSNSKLFLAEKVMD